MGSEIRRYCNTDELVEKDGLLYLHPDRVWLTDEPDPDAGVSIDMWNHEEQFMNQPAGMKYPFFNMALMYGGKYGLPRWAYDPDTDTFTEVEAWTLDWGLNTIRRREIERDINVSGVKLGTELKKLRLCVVAILRAHPELANDPAVVEFNGLSDYIEARIVKHEKGTAKARAKARKDNREDDDWWMGRNQNG